MANHGCSVSVDKFAKDTQDYHLALIAAMPRTRAIAIIGGYRATAAVDIAADYSVVSWKLLLESCERWDCPPVVSR